MKFYVHVFYRQKLVKFGISIKIYRNALRKYWETLRNREKSQATRKSNFLINSVNKFENMNIPAKKVKPTNMRQKILNIRIMSLYTYRWIYVIIIENNWQENYSSRLLHFKFSMQFFHFCRFFAVAL